MQGLLWLDSLLASLGKSTVAQLTTPARRQFDWYPAICNTWLYRSAKGALAQCPKAPMRKETPFQNRRTLPIHCKSLPNLWLTLFDWLQSSEQATDRTPPFADDRGLAAFSSFGELP